MCEGWNITEYKIDKTCNYMNTSYDSGNMCWGFKKVRISLNLLFWELRHVVQSLVQLGGEDMRLRDCVLARLPGHTHAAHHERPQLCHILGGHPVQTPRADKMCGELLESVCLLGIYRVHVFTQINMKTVEKKDTEKKIFLLISIF